MLETIVVFVLVLLVLVLIHEFGHFLVAKLFGIKVEEFGFGLPPRAFGIKKGETIYSLNWLPIGGFVKLYGEDEAGAGRISRKSQVESHQANDLNRAFFSKSAWARALVVVAGVIMNFLLAWVIMSYLAVAQGIPHEDNTVLVANVIPNAPAAKAGLKENDTIQAINGQAITSTQQVIAITHSSLGKPVTITFKTPTNQEKTVTVTPRKNYPANEGPMGVAIGQKVTAEHVSLARAPFVGLKQTVNAVGLIVGGLGTLVSDIVVQKTVPKDIAGPVGIAQLTGQFIQVGPNAVLSLVALLSANLAVVNILPIPALDGGRFFFILIEAITGKKVNAAFEERAHVIGMAILITLILLITLHDIFRILSGQPLLPQ